MNGDPSQQLAQARRLATEHRVDERRRQRELETMEERHRREEAEYGVDNDNDNQSVGLYWSKHLLVILAGTHDSGSPWFLLNGYEDVLVKEIYSWMVAGWERAVQRGAIEDRFYSSYRPHLPVAFAICRSVNFPSARDICINGMPFIMGDKHSLPRSVWHYYPMIMSCPLQDSELGKVCYLTIHEGWVAPGKTQRRPGLHIEAPNTARSPSSTSSSATTQPLSTTLNASRWGCGLVRGHDKYHGGIFMASSLSNSCAIYNALIADRAEVDCHGGVEHLRPHLGDSQMIQANELVWFTDTTPHEALPLLATANHRMEVPQYRQFFRLVTSDVNVWYKEHSTSNPLVTLPPSVHIIEGSKFNGNTSDASSDWSGNQGQKTPSDPPHGGCCEIV